METRHSRVHLLLFVLIALHLALVGLPGCKGGSDSETDTESESSTDTDTATETDPTQDSDTTDDTGTGTPVTYMDIPADNGQLLYNGRIDFSDPAAPSFAYPAISIRMGFSGSAVGMRLDDGGSTSMPNYYGVIVDDGEMEKVEMTPGLNEYDLATGLDDGEHTIELVKLNESANGWTANRGLGTFHGFLLDENGQVRPVEPRPGKVEFIGDSITCGFGNEESVSYAEISTNPGEYGYSSINSNGWLAWGAVTARQLDAEYMAVCYSGRGITRNYGGGGGLTMPQMYPLIFPDNAAGPTWDTSQWVPDLLVINLGTNDFSEGLDTDSELDAMRADYRDGYVAFVQTLRGYYPDTPFILAVGPMINDSWPPGYSAWTSIQADVTAVVDTLNTAGDNNVFYLSLGIQSEPFGEDYHPTAATHARMAQDVVDFVTNNSLM